jgi:hypothetical protein
MAARTNFYFRQKVTEAELDLAFEMLEKADQHLATDLGVYGIISGAEPIPHSPLPDLRIDLTAPAKAYDRLGQRIFFGSGQAVDCSVDFTGLPTEVSSSTNERWVGVFLRFDRLLSDPRTDGNSQQVFFRRDESFSIVVRQAAEAPLGSGLKAPLVENELLVCDVRRTAGQSQILEADIDTSRRQGFVFAWARAVGVTSGLWTILAPNVTTAQAALDSVDAELNDHFSGSSRRHAASHVDYVPHGFVSQENVQAAIDEILDSLGSATAGSPGASKVGAGAVTGTPHALPAGHVDGQISQLLGLVNTHLGSTDHDSRYYRIGQQVGDAQTLEGKRPADFALASHNHDSRYLREKMTWGEIVPAGTTRVVHTADVAPHDVSVGYMRLDASGNIESSLFIAGPLSSSILCWVSQTTVSGVKQFQVSVTNNSSESLYIIVRLYAVD